MVNRQASGRTGRQIDGQDERPTDLPRAKITDRYAVKKIGTLESTQAQKKTNMKAH